MAIRIRKINGDTFALCAAKSYPKHDDIYLDDDAHHALTVKFENDFRSMGFMSDKFLNETTVKRSELIDFIEYCKLHSSENTYDTIYNMFEYYEKSINAAKRN